LWIDAIIFSIQRYGGIGVYFQQILKKLEKEKISASILFEMPLKQNLTSGYPPNFSIISRQARSWERYRYCRVPDGGAVFHSSYYRLPRGIGTPSVVTVHDFVYERYAKGPRRWVHMRQKHAAIRAAQAVICVSEATRQDLMEFVGEIPGQSVHVIHNGVSEVFRSLLLGSAPAPYVLYVGERRGYKNFTRLLAAMEFLPDLELHCVGGGDLRAEELAAAPASARHRIRHLGFVTDEALNEHYNRALCLVYPSSYEGFGIPVAEAMRAGCPVVSAQCKAVLEVGGDALTVAADADPRALADAVLRLTNVEYRNQVVSTGFEISRRFSWDRTHEGTLEVYRSLGASLKPSY
jgi:mannosyltransferase